jgi:DNA repair protein RecO (recombination protein O)
MLDYFGRMTLVVTDAVVLHLFDYLESSLIVRLATRQLGVQSVLARGARRPRNRFGSSLDVFASGVAQFSARPGRDLHNLSGFDLTRSRMPLASSLERFSAAAAIAELALAFAHGGPDEPVFEVLIGSLDAVTAAPADRADDAGLASAWRIVAALGFGPSLDACAVCRAEVEEQEPAPFSHAAGGVVCRRCRPTVSISRILPSDARRTLLDWMNGAASEPLDRGARRAHVRLLREFLAHHLADGRDLRALRAWESRLRRHE